MINKNLILFFFLAFNISWSQNNMDIKGFLSILGEKSFLKFCIESGYQYVGTNNEEIMYAYNPIDSSSENVQSIAYFNQKTGVIKLVIPNPFESNKANSNVYNRMKNFIEQNCGYEMVLNNSNKTRSPSIVYNCPFSNNFQYVEIFTNTVKNEKVAYFKTF